VATKADLFAALARRGLFEVIPGSVSEEPRQLRFLGRVPLDHGGENMRRWLEVVDAIHVASETAAWKADICKWYFRREGRQLYAWRLILQAESIGPALGGIVHALEAVRAPGEVAEFALPGATADRNAVVGGRRGAGAVGSVPLGPMALHLRMGG
jgi:hypothetical protein